MSKTLWKQVYGNKWKKKKTNWKGIKKKIERKEGAKNAKDLLKVWAFEAVFSNRKGWLGILVTTF